MDRISEMRDFAIKRIKQIKRKENGFDKQSVKWKDFYCEVYEEDPIHISDFNFGYTKNKLISWEDVYDDGELLELFEKIIKVHYSVA